MKEHFLSYEQSLAVKELGFDEACIATWGYNAKLEKFISYDHPLSQNEALGMLAPLKSQFFKWVREKYKISGAPQYFTGGYYCYTINDMKDTEKSNRLFTEFETYEQAEDACINKIIELLKLK